MSLYSVDPVCCRLRWLLLSLRAWNDCRSAPSCPYNQSLYLLNVQVRTINTQAQSRPGNNAHVFQSLCICILCRGWKGASVTVVIGILTLFLHPPRFNCTFLIVTFPASSTSILTCRLNSPPAPFTPIFGLLRFATKMCSCLEASPSGGFCRALRIGSFGVLAHRLLSATSGMCIIHRDPGLMAGPIQAARLLRWTSGFLTREWSNNSVPLLLFGVLVLPSSYTHWPA